MTPRTNPFSELDPHRLRQNIEDIEASGAGGIDTSKIVFFDDFFNGSGQNFPTSGDTGGPWFASVAKGASAKMTGDIDGSGWCTIGLPDTDGDFAVSILTDALLFDTREGLTFEARIAVDGINGITTAFYGFTSTMHFTLAGSYELLATDEIDNHSTGKILDPTTAYVLKIDASDLDAVKFYCDDDLLYTSGAGENAGNVVGARLLHSKASSIAGVQKSWIDYVLIQQASRGAFAED